jgi:addiction module HigA family antidote
MMQMFNPPHPGRIVKDAVRHIPMTVTEFAAHIGVSRVALSRVMNQRSGITAEMSIKFSQAFGQGQPDIWFKMQNDHDFWHAAHAKRTKVKKLKVREPEEVKVERPHRGAKAAKLAKRAKGGGQRGTRTPDILLVRQAL